jgi:hypothetical protein
MHDNKYFELLSKNKKYGIHQSWCFQNNINISILQNFFKLERYDKLENKFIFNIMNNNIKNVDEKLGKNNILNFDINKKFIIIHDNSINKLIDSNWNILDPYNISDKFLESDNIINLSNLSNILFDSIKLFENNNNDEIHLINSIWLIIIYYLIIRYGINKNKKIFIHHYCRDRKHYIFNFYYPKINNIYEIFSLNNKKNIYITNKMDFELKKKIYDNYHKDALLKYYNEDIFKKYYNTIPKFRDYTFSYCFEDILKKYRLNNERINILELGTCRSFTDGKYEGCMENNLKYWNPDDPEKWDWSAGMFTKYFSELLDIKNIDFNIYTIDIDNKALSISKTINQEYDDKILFINSTSENFLNNCQNKPGAPGQ